MRLILLLASLAAAETAPPPEPVTLPSMRTATLVRPTHTPAPGIVLVEGWWDAWTWEATTADRLASAGFAVLRVLPDRQRPPAGDRDALHRMMAAPPAPAAHDALAGAAAWLARHPDVRPGGVAVVGARMGGRDALALAGAPQVRGVVSWYGVPPPASNEAARSVPTLAFFGGRDMGPTVEDARRFEEARRGSATRVVVYPEAQHGFADEKNPWGGYDAASAADSWTQATAFLREVLALDAGPRRGP